jgi:hypothetical protein
MLRDLPFSALQFAFYEQFKRWTISARRHFTGSTKSISDHIPWEVANGLAAGGLAGFITTPLGVSHCYLWTYSVDVVKTRIQTGTRRSPTKAPNLNVPQTPLVAGFSSAPRNIRTQSVLTALRQVYDHEGWRGLFRGMGPRSGWCGCQSGVMFLGYEFFLRVLENWESGLENIGS